VRPSELRAARHRAKLLQVELARKVGVHRRKISLWERGLEPIPSERLDWIREVLAPHLLAQSGGVEKA
jgi:transcriptional regulator with XRE-family HTH domain